MFKIQKANRCKLYSLKVIHEVQEFLCRVNFQLTNLLSNYSSKLLIEKLSDYFGSLAIQLIYHY